MSELEPTVVDILAIRRAVGRRQARLVSAVRTGVFIGAIALFFVFRPVAAGGFTSYAFVVGTSMVPTLHTGDLAIVIRQPAYRVGDIVSFHPSADPDGTIVHRIVGGDPVTGFVTKGDNREDLDPDRTPAASLVGKVVLSIPGGGLVLNALRNPGVLGAIAALAVVLVGWSWLGDGETKRKRRERLDTR